MAKEVKIVMEVNGEESTVVTPISKQVVTDAMGYTPLDASLKGASSGLAELDDSGLVVSSQLPSFVDDVIEGYYYENEFYEDSEHETQLTPESGKIYVDLISNKTYRWSGSLYTVISDTLALGETSSTAFRGDHGKTAYEHSQSEHAPVDAEKNQNAFSNVLVGEDLLKSNTTSDTVNFKAGENITLTPNTTTNTVEISAKDTTYENVTEEKAGLSSPEDKKKLDGIDEGANKYTLPAAGEETLGGVKSGGDVTITDGIIEVNDDSHNHTIQNITGLQTALDNRSLTSHGHKYAASNAIGGSASKVYVGQTTEDDTERGLMFAQATPTQSGQGDTITCIDTELTYNPSTKTLTVPNIIGTVEKAIADENGDNIAENIAEVKSAAAINKSTLGYSRKNLLPPINSVTRAGITYTVSSDGKVTLTGANTSASYNYFSIPVTLKSGKYIVSGMPSGGSNNTYRVDLRSDASGGTVFGYGTTPFEVEFSETTTVYYMIRIDASYTSELNLTFYPMIRLADITDSTYEPYIDDVDTRLSTIENDMETHTHPYLPLAGGTMDNVVDVKFPRTSDDRYYRVGYQGVKFSSPTSSTQIWSSSWDYFKNDGTTLLGSIGAKGTGGKLEYYYIGTGYTNPLFEMDTSGNATFTGSVTAPSFSGSGATFSNSDPWKSLTVGRSSVELAESYIAGIDFTMNDTSVGRLGFNGIETFFVRNGDNSNLLSLDTSGNATFTGSVTATSFVGNATTANKVANSLTIQGNGTTLKTYNGSSAQTVNITPSNIGAAASSHTHSSYANQNAFSNVVVGSTTIAADTTTDTLTLAAGSNITLTPDATNDKVTITATNTTYSQATSSALGLVKIGYTASGKNYPVALNSSGQMYVNVPWTDNNTTYSNMTGATSSAAGKAGLVPAPAAGKQASFLRGDGTWVVPTNTTYSNFVKSGSGAKAGLVPAPSTTAGTTKYLREDGTWSVPPDHNTTYSVFGKSGSSAAIGLVPAPSTTAGTTKYLREDGTWTVPPNTDTKNTAGSGNTSSKIYLIGATSQATNPTTYSHDTVFVDTAGAVNSTQGIKFTSGGMYLNAYGNLMCNSITQTSSNWGIYDSAESVMLMVYPHSSNRKIETKVPFTSSVGYSSTPLYTSTLSGTSGTITISNLWNYSYLIVEVKNIDGNTESQVTPTPVPVQFIYAGGHFYLPWFDFDTQVTWRSSSYIKLYKSSTANSFTIASLGVTKIGVVNIYGVL